MTGASYVASIASYLRAYFRLSGPLNFGILNFMTGATHFGRQHADLEAWAGRGAVGSTEYYAAIAGGPAFAKCSTISKIMASVEQRRLWHA